MAGALYPHATHITGIYHAREHLTDLASHLAFITPDPARWLADRSEVPRGFRTVHPLGWTSGKVK